MSAPEWWPDWRGQTCVIVASGPSAKEAALSLARDKAKVIVINTSWKLAPWADVLYACDWKWWAFNRGATEFNGLKISQDPKAPRSFPGVKTIKCTRKTKGLLLDEPGVIGWGGNGGFQAINLAVQFGARRIILVGYDMRTDHGVHWHGKHPTGLNNPNRARAEKWREGIDGIAKQLISLGVKVINASPVSALTAYPKLSLEDALRTKV